MELYKILFVIGFIFVILGMIPIFCGFIKTIFDMIIYIKNHDYDMLPELLLSIGAVIMLIAVIFMAINEVK